MLSREGIMEIKVLARQGRSIRDIAREMQVSRNTVRRHLRASGRPPNRYAQERRSQVTKVGGHQRPRYP